MHLPPRRLRQHQPPAPRAQRGTDGHLPGAPETPSEKQASTRPPLAAARAALEAVVLPSIIGSSDPDVCSPDAAIVVPLRGAPGAYKANKLKLKTRAEVYSGEFDSDGLELRCNPS